MSATFGVRFLAAFGIVAAHRQGKAIEVFATEVRPRGQGLLTIRRLNDEGIRTNYIVDSAARSFMNEVDLVIVGADAITVNGAHFTQVGTPCMAWIRCSWKTRAPFQNSPSPSETKACWNT